MAEMIKAIKLTPRAHGPKVHLKLSDVLSHGSIILGFPCLSDEQVKKNSDNIRKSLSRQCTANAQESIKMQLVDIQIKESHDDAKEYYKIVKIPQETVGHKVALEKQIQYLTLRLQEQLELNKSTEKFSENLTGINVSIRQRDKLQLESEALKVKIDELNKSNKRLNLTLQEISERLARGHYADITTELAEHFAEIVPEYKAQIRNKLEINSYPHPSDDDIKVVKLISYSEVEALSVDPENHQVYFKRFEPSTQDLDDTSIFIRVIIDHDDNTMMIWINLNTLLPIARRDDNNLYTIAPQCDVLLPTCIDSQQRPISRSSQDLPNDHDPFYWLDIILQSPDAYTNVCFFYEQGAGHVKIHPIRDPPPESCRQGETWICKESVEVDPHANPHAILDTYHMGFTIHSYYF